MNYTDLLNKIIKESKMSNIEIVRKCEENGEKITPNYLSILRNTKGRIPSENVSKALAKACNAEKEDILIVQAYIDKAPKKILHFIEKVYEGTKSVTFQLLEENKKNWGEIEYKTYIENANREFDEMTLADFICNYLGDDIKPAEVNIIDSGTQKNPLWVIVPLENAKIITDEQMKMLNHNEGASET